MRDVPTYAVSIQQGVVGDDPLGLAPMNERLYNSAFPGFNNYVQYIRVYSAICWMTRQVSLALEGGAARTEKEAKILFQEAIEKIELALVWANEGVSGLAGTRRQFPEHSQPVKLVFATFGTSAAKLFDAPTYRPSLTSGLMFLEARAGGTYGCLPYGKDLADAFDRVVHDLPGYLWLKAPDRLEGRRSQIEKLRPALDITKPSLAEREAFLRSFFPQELPESPTQNDRARWSTLQLMLRSVDAVSRQFARTTRGGTVASQQVRACMARGMTAGGIAIVSGGLETVQGWWAVLQLRQLQRLCLEALYCVVERWIADREIDRRSRTLEDCVQQVSHASDATLPRVLRGNVDRVVAHFARAQRKHPTLYQAAAMAEMVEPDEEHEADLFAHIDGLRDKKIVVIDDDGSSVAAGNAYIGLIFCATETANLKSKAHTLKAMQADGDACSLLRLLNLVSTHGKSTPAQFLRVVIREWIILRHFAIASSRSIPFDGKNRFRFVIGDFGLERFDKSANLPVPGMSVDKLNHALMLSTQGGLLAYTAGGYQLTPRGRRHLLKY